MIPSFETLKHINWIHVQVIDLLNLHIHTYIHTYTWNCSRLSRLWHASTSCMWRDRRVGFMHAYIHTYIWNWFRLLGLWNTHTECLCRWEACGSCVHIHTYIHIYMQQLLISIDLNVYTHILHTRTVLLCLYALSIRQQMSTYMQITAWASHAHTAPQTPVQDQITSKWHFMILTLKVRITY